VRPSPSHHRPRRNPNNLRLTPRHRLQHHARECPTTRLNSDRLLQATPRKVARRLNRELASLTSGWESTRPDLSLDRKSRRTRYSRDDDADAAPVSPRSQHLADQVMEGVVSDDDNDRQRLGVRRDR
jgi:hypothetical protein